jgi:hypothetical protein
MHTLLTETKESNIFSFHLASITSTVESSESPDIERFYADLSGLCSTAQIATGGAVSHAAYICYRVPDKRNGLIPEEV